MNALIKGLYSIVLSNTNYTEFFLIVGIVFIVVIICSVILFWHNRVLKKQDQNKDKEHLGQ